MEFVKLEKRGHIALLKLNRPKALNALNTAMLNEIEMAAAKVERDPEVRVLIISGEGKAFGAGADIGEMVGLSRAEAKAFADAGHRAFKRIDDLVYTCYSCYPWLRPGRRAGACTVLRHKALLRNCQVRST